MNEAYAQGDTSKAYELLVLLEESEAGVVRSYDPKLKLLGAVNREGVTCYLDALLFAMFARLGSFEAMLYKNLEDPPRKRLATLLRLWVNTLRAGKLITTDIVRTYSPIVCRTPLIDSCRQGRSNFSFPNVAGRTLLNYANRILRKLSLS